jgi:16S rRNA (guanine966-N2)-methyltransferase
MRIVAGELRSRRLRVPKGDATRPTTDRARESLFARLGPIDGLDVIDPFAGTGALGLEALSRGAASCVFGERARAALECLRDNVDALGVAGRSRIVRGDGARLLRDEAAAGRRYGLVLLDPPYTLLPRLLPALGDLVEGVAATGALVALEAPTGLDVDLGPGLEHRSATRTGIAVHHLFAMRDRDSDTTPTDDASGPR